MHITVHCPGCQNRYQLNPELRGQTMRCPNPTCRQVFEVREDQPPPAIDVAVPPPPQRPVSPADRRQQPPNRAIDPDSLFVTGSVGEIIPILDAEPAYPVAEPAAPDRPTSHVQDIVPMLPAEIVEPVEPIALEPPPRRRPSAVVEPPIAQPPSWMEAPPPVRQPPAPERPRTEPAPVAPPPPSPPRATPAIPMGIPVAPGKSSKIRREPRPGTTEIAAAPPSGPRELPPGTWEAPPVRQPGSDSGTATWSPALSETAGGPALSEHETAAEPSKSRRNIIIALVCFGLVVVMGGLAFVVLKLNDSQAEKTIYEQAKKDYENHDFTAAETGYRKLAVDYPASPKFKEYKFFADLSEVRKQVGLLSADPETLIVRVSNFVESFEDNQALKDYSVDVWQTYGEVVERMMDRAQHDRKNHDLSKAEAMLVRAEQAYKEGDRFRPEGTPENSTILVKLNDELDKIRATLRFIELAGTMSATPEAQGELLGLARQLGIDKESEVLEVLGKLKERLLTEVRYVKMDVPAVVPDEKNAPSVAVLPQVGDLGFGLAPGQGVVFALARGVLYALAERDGKLLWATRVGIDTTMLPVRLPVTEDSPDEVVLVVASQDNTLTARLAHTGKALWQRPLEAACLGRPLVVDRRAYVPTYDGKIHEIETVQGTLLGQYQVGAPLSVGGTRQEGTDLVYFPAESRCVYAIDVKKHECVAVLETGHSSGLLRGEPIVVSWPDLPAVLAGDPETRPQFLILAQADGLNQMKLQAFRLPIERDSKPLEPELRIRGWSWFPPACDRETIAMTTDAGVFELIGINQIRNQDPPLFRRYPSGFELPGASAQAGRAQVVHAEDRAFWVLAKGELQYLQLGLDPQLGPRLAPQWSEPLRLGSPLHAAQVNERQHNTLFVVTQALTHQTYLATAVDAATGRIRWQRQLGLLCQADPVLVDSQVVVLDQGAGLFLFDPERPTRTLLGESWQEGGQTLAPPRAEERIAPAARGPTPFDLSTSFLFVSADGKSLCAIHYAGKGRRRLTVSVYQSGMAPKEYQFTLHAALAGTPAWGPGALVLPLADGTLLRQPLADGAEADGAPPWRARHADADARGHVVFLDGFDYLSTDGSNSLVRVEWKNKEWKDKGTVKLPDRIVTAPVVLPRARPEDPLQVVVADRSGRVTLLQGDRLAAVRTWELKGEITAGPFVRDQGLGVIVDRTTLVWIDPTKAETAWKYTANASLVGLPQRVGDWIMVADLSGTLVALDSANGKVQGKPYQVPANVAPATTPVRFGKDRLFAPLTDGTALLLPLEAFQPDRP